jgi:hypothetical protein
MWTRSGSLSTAEPVRCAAATVVRLTTVDKLETPRQQSRTQDHGGVAVALSPDFKD